MASGAWSGPISTALIRVDPSSIPNVVRPWSIASPDVRRLVAHLSLDLPGRCSVNVLTDPPGGHARCRVGRLRVADVGGLGTGTWER